MPILGTIASSYLQAVGSFESIATISLTSGTASTISFTSIPSTYKNLQIRAVSRTSDTELYGDVYARFNGDSNNNYGSHQLYGSGVNGQALLTGIPAGSTSVADLYPFFGAGDGSSSNMFGVLIMDIYDYTSTNKYKTTHAMSGYNSGNTGNISQNYVLFRTGNWRSTSAITSIEFRPNPPTKHFLQYTHFALYGMKSA